MHVSQIVPSLEEKSGGPSKSVLALALAQARLGAEVDLFTTDPRTSSRERIESLTVCRCERGVPRSLCVSTELRRQLDAAPSEIVHHHSLWLRTLHYARRHAQARRVPLVLSPRGMMSGWAWRHHHWRKQLARRCIHPGAMEAVAGWHATSEEEARDIRALGFRQPICVAPNGVVTPSAAERAAAAAHWQAACPDVTRRKTALFYSRFHQKKRVIELIDLWLQHAPPDWLLLLVGLPEEYSPGQLEAYVLRSSGGDRVRVMDGAGCPPPYAVASLFLLPSHSENFGLAIAEAMANGVPVVVTDTTPWLAINDADAGWCVPWERYPAALRDALAEDSPLRAERGRRAHDYVVTHCSWQDSAARLLQFYQQLTGHG